MYKTVLFTKPDIQLEIPVVVKAKANNYRYSRKSKSFYKSKSLQQSEIEFKKHLKKLRKPFSSKIAIEIDFYIKRSGIRDVDNLLKSTLDLLQPDIIKNDNLVYLLVAKKHQVENNEPERTVIRIWRL